MAKVMVKLDRQNIGEWLKSQEMMNMLQGRADEALANLEGCTSTQHVGQSRCNVTIETAGRRAHDKNLKTNAILKALR